MKFRALKESEIECRAQTVKENGLSLLLYKDARCDMSILDETVGPMNWKREHSRENANCTVSIARTQQDEDNQLQVIEWVGKEDTGTESNTEKAKGLASDSFKRACFNWGIGRELYTAPFIWVTDAGGKYVKDTGRKDKWGNPVYTTTYDAKFYVEKVKVVEGIIEGISIKDKAGKRVFVWEIGA
jgi:hypothetical protein